MTPPDERQNLKRIICDFITDAMLPGQVAQRVAQSLEEGPDPRIMAQAIEGAKDKVRLIMEHIPHLNSQAFLLRIPGPDFLEFVLFSEYILFNSLRGERGTLRYAKRSREKAGQTMARCLNRLGFFTPEDLEPFREQIVNDYDDGPGMWQQMVQSLSQQPKEKLLVLKPETSPAAEGHSVENQSDQNLGAPVAGGQGGTPRRLASARAQRGQG